MKSLLAILIVIAFQTQPALAGKNHLHARIENDGSVTLIRPSIGYPTVNPEMERQRRNYYDGLRQINGAAQVSNDCNAFMDQLQTSVLSSDTYKWTARESLEKARKYYESAQNVHDISFRYTDDDNPHTNGSPAHNKKMESKRALADAKSKLDKMQQARDQRDAASRIILNQINADHKAKHIAYRTFMQNVPKNPCTGCSDSLCNQKFADDTAQNNIKSNRCCDSTECRDRFSQEILGKQPAHTVIPPAVMLSTQTQTAVVAQNGNTRNELSSPTVTPHLENAASDYLRDQLDFSEDLTKDAVNLAKSGGSMDTVKLKTDLAQDISNAAKSFVSGFGKGAYTSFQNLTDVAHAIYQDPTLVAHLYGNTMNYITSAQSLQDLKGAWKDYVVAYNTGDFNKVGEYLGRLGGDTLIVLAGMKMVDPMPTQAFEGLGRHLEKGIRAEPKIAGEVAAIDAIVADFKAAGFTEADYYAMKPHADNAIQVRDGYNIDIATDIPSEISKLTGKGTTLEEIARSVHQIRRDLGDKYKNLTHPTVRKIIYGRNLSKYGDELGPTFDILVKDLQSDNPSWTHDQILDKIIKSSQTPNKRLNRAIEALKK